jgi:two-component system sensor histidine kinase KdpD
VVYDIDTVPGALANFFRRENLVALRELALRKTAEEVDDFLERIVPDADSLHPWAAEERVLVCVRPGPLATRLVRRAHRLARRLQGRLWVLHVHTDRPDAAARRELDDIFALARTLGGEVVELEGDSVGEEILRFARERHASFIVVGQSRRSRLDEILRGSQITRIIREIDCADVLVVADPVSLDCPV